MLRSTYQTPTAPPALPEGWTEHKAPTGHSYYYHAATKKSTYTRPALEEPEVVVESLPEPAGTHIPTFAAPEVQSNGRTRQNSNQESHWSSRDPRADRPKHKKSIPGCSPWILVTTKFRRRFIYNPDLGESFWKFPQDILLAVAELDRKEAARKERRAKGEPSDSEPEQNNIEEDEEYEEVEVTDDEGLDAEGDAKPAKADKPQPADPVEFNEDDFAFQLAMMEQGQDDDDFEEDLEEAPPLDPVDAAALFSDLLSDFGINPYAPWDQVIENMTLVEDPRYTSLPNMKSRREVFDEWSRVNIAEIAARRAIEAKKDPRIGYFALLDEHANPKLYWPEFKRKFKKEQAMKDTKISDKDREKLYREHINRLKLPQATLKSDLKALLKEQPLSKLNRSSQTESLPSSVSTDLRYISLRSSDRTPLIQAYIELLDGAPVEDAVEDTDAVAIKAKEDRARRENALREREQKVEEEKKRRARQEKASRELLRQGEADLEQATRVGRDGLRGHLADDKQDEMEQ